MSKKITPKKVTNKDQKFSAGDFAVYPAHGIGQVTKIEDISVEGQKVRVLVMYFDKEKLTIKVPEPQFEKIGIRPLVTKETMEEVFNILRSGIKKLKGMWSRRAQEYESKINSGDINLLAEVLRDLARDINDGDRSYSERIIYETAVHRLATEYALIYGISFEQAKEDIISTAKNKITDGEDNFTIQKDIEPLEGFDDGFDAEEEEEEEDEDHEEEYEEDEERAEDFSV